MAYQRLSYTAPFGLAAVVRTICGMRLCVRLYFTVMRNTGTPSAGLAPCTQRRQYRI